jgi:type II secretory pathway component GspD/PulD (secretin)
MSVIACLPAGRDSSDSADTLTGGRMYRIALLIGMVLAIAPGKAQTEQPPAIGEMELKIKAFEDRTIYAKTKIVPLENVDASEIEPFISTRLSMYGKVQVNDVANTLIITDMEPKLSDLVRLVKKLDSKGMKEFVRLETQTLFPKFVPPSKLDSILRKNLSPEGAIQVDDDLNAIMITDVHSRIERIKKIIGELDVPPRQVLIEGKLVAVDSDYLREIGLHLPSLIQAALRESYISLESSESNSGGEEYKTESSRMAIRSDLPALIALINQSVGEGNASISSFPSLVIQNNKQGEVHLSGFGSPHSIGLFIEPHIGAGDFMSLDVEFFTGENLGDLVSEGRRGKRRSRMRRRSSYDSEYYYPLEESRVLSASDHGVNTTVMAKDGATFVLGGIECTETGTVEKGVPILRSIPLLGWLFKRETKVTGKKELVVLITPRILEFGESSTTEKE